MQRQVINNKKAETNKNINLQQYLKKCLQLLKFYGYLYKVQLIFELKYKLKILSTGVKINLEFLVKKELKFVLTKIVFEQG